MTPPPPPFDPFYYAEQVSDEKSITTKLIVKAAEKLVLVQAGGTAPQDALNNGYRVQLVPKDCDLYVNADIVRIAGVLQQRERTVQINARVIEACKGTDGKPPSIDVSGKPGPAPDPNPIAPKMDKPTAGKNGEYQHDHMPFSHCAHTDPVDGVSGKPGKDGNNGARGGNAGRVDLCCGELTALDNTKISLIATGGTGGDGQGGQPGQDGADGGKGANAQFHFTFDDVGRDGANAGRGGAGGRGGPGGVGGNGGSIRVCTLTPFDTKKLAANVAPGSNGKAGATAHGGNDGTPGAGGDEYWDYDSDHRWTKLVDGGQKGGYIAAIPQPALVVVPQTPPTKGTATISPVGTTPDYDNAQITADDDQLAMLLDRVRLDILDINKHDTKNKTAVTLLQQRLDWLIGICGGKFFAMQQYQSQARTAIGLAAAGLRKNLRDPQRDAFGNRVDWVPITALNQYDSLLGNELGGDLGILKEAESEWQAYIDLRKQGHEVQSQVTSALAAANVRISDVTAKLETARQQLAGLSVDITDLVTDVADAKDAARAALANVKKMANAKLTLDPWKYLDVIESAAWGISDPPMAAVIGGIENLKYWQSAFTDLQGDDGQTYQKSYVVKQMDKLDDDLRNLDESYQVLDSGFLQANDPDGYKLLATQDGIDNLIDNFKSTLDGVQDAEDKVEAYVQIALKRNGLVLDYNAALTQLVQLKAQLDQLNDRAAKLSDKSAAFSLPLADRFQQGLYERARQNVVTDLYCASRAYRFWKLDNVDVFADLAASDYSNITYLSASAAKQRIRSNSVQGANALVGNLQRRTQPVVISFDISKHPEILASFKKERGTGKNQDTSVHFWEFALTPPTSNTTSDENPFVDMTNVRLDEVRCWLVGLESTDKLGNVKVHVIQRGDEQIVPLSGTKPISMRHEPIEKVFEYSMQGKGSGKGSVITRATYWVPKANWEGELPTCTPIGPFATWRIALRPQDFENSKINWDTLVAIQLEFFVYTQGIETKTAN